LKIVEFWWDRKLLEKLFLRRFKNFGPRNMELCLYRVGGNRARLSCGRPPSLNYRFILKAGQRCSFRRHFD